jgi:phosphoglycolate phosphatase
MKYKYIVFDFNGTIIDDVQLCLDLLNEMLEVEHLPLVSYSRYKEIFTFPIIEYYKKAGFTFENRSFKEMSEWFVKKYQPASYKCNLYPNIREEIASLKERGYKVILLSASQIDNLKEQTDRFNITSLFDKILGIDNIEAKSKLEIAKKYFEKENINMKECLFIGDSTHDYEVGHTLGGDVLLVTYGHQSKEVLSSCNVPLIDSILEVEKYL